MHERQVRSENQTGSSSHSSRLPLRLEGGPQKPCAHNVSPCPQKRQEDASQEENAAVSMNLRFFCGKLGNGWAARIGRNGAVKGCSCQ